MSAFVPSTPVPAPGNGRYTLGPAQATVEGNVAVGTDRNGRSFLVHAVGRATESIALHAVATAIGSGKTIAYADLVAAVKECGKLDQLAKEVEKATA
jgi:carbon monoxide dehydrogenase subunit G